MEMVGGIGSGRWLAQCLLLIGITSVGCAPALSSFSPAHVPEPGHVQAEVGADVFLPAGPLRDLRSNAESLDDSADDEPLTDEQRRDVTRAAWALALNPPMLNTHVGVGVGLVHHLELQGRLTTGAWRLGGRYQLLNAAEHGIDFTTGLGVGRHKASFSGLNLFKIIEFEDFERWQIDVPMVFGRHGNWYRWWGGPRAMFVKYDSGMNMSLPAIEAANYEGSETQIDLSGTGWYLGGQLGGAIGYKHIFLAAELTVAQFFGTTELRTSGDGAFGDFSSDASGLVVVPGIGLMGEF